MTTATKELSWKEKAYRFLCDFPEKGFFLAEDVRIAFVEAGNTPPNDSRAWGGVFNRACFAGVIIADGVGASKTGRGRLMTRWAKGLSA